MGWLPQELVLFAGTVAENIARLAPEPDPEAVIRAAERAGAHGMILALPGGYDFQVAAGGAALSGGQRQRITLARAFHGDPAVVIVQALLRFELTGPAGMAGVRICCHPGCESRSVIPARPALAIPADYEQKNIRNCPDGIIQAYCNGRADGAG